MKVVLPFFFRTVLPEMRNSEESPACHHCQNATCDTTDLHPLISPFHRHFGESLQGRTLKVTGYESRGTIPVALLSILTGLVVRRGT